MLGSKLNSKKRMIFILIVVNIIWIILIIRVGIIQFIEGEKWKTRSENQQYVSRSIIAGRGTIFDSSGEIILAQSSTVETVTVNPVNISTENKEKVSKALEQEEYIKNDVAKTLKDASSAFYLGRGLDYNLAMEGALKIKEISFGGNSYMNFQIKDIMTEAIKMKAPKIILIHNHPSGDATPSEVDVKFTELSMKVADLLGIELMDHIVIGNGKFTSILSEMAEKIAKEARTKDNNIQNEGKDRG